MYLSSVQMCVCTITCALLFGCVSNASERRAPAQSAVSRKGGGTSERASDEWTDGWMGEWSDDDYYFTMPLPTLSIHPPRLYRVASSGTDTYPSSSCRFTRHARPPSVFRLIRGLRARIQPLRSPRPGVPPSFSNSDKLLQRCE